MGRRPPAAAGADWQPEAAWGRAPLWGAAGVLDDGDDAFTVLARELAVSRG